MRKFKTQPGGTSKSSPAERERVSTNFTRTVVRGLAGKLETPVVTADGQKTRGNVTGQPARVKFTPDNTGAYPPAFASHRLGYAVSNFHVIAQNGPGSVFTSKTRIPTKQGTWFEIADAVGDVTVDLHLYGPRKGNTP